MGMGQCCRWVSGACWSVAPSLCALCDGGVRVDRDASLLGAELKNQVGIV